MDSLRLLYIYAYVLQYGSMNAAAAQLGMTASAVSQHIRKLEQHYQVQLLVRNTRKLCPTEAGKILWHYANQLIALHAETEQAMSQMQLEPSGTVHLSIPTAFASARAFGAAIKALHEQYPNIILNVQETNRFIDFEKEKIDIAIRVLLEPPSPSDLIVRPLQRWQLHLYAHPDYLARQPITQISDLLHANWLNHNDAFLLNFFNLLELPAHLPKRRIDCPHNSMLAKTMACAGLGVVMLLEGDAEQEVADGRLQQVLPQLDLYQLTVYAVTPHRSQSAKVQAVLDMLKRHFHHGSTSK